ncbi:MAG: metallophosphoesterase [Bacteroidetes bacterium]|nr:MAG: metallophosphoesterase [Bacteroidota bacterium]
MRIAIISDIHANLEALTTALEIIEKRDITEIICLGDIVGYGANPNECMELVLRHTSSIVLGNHDEAAVNLAAAEYFNPYARIAAEWTNSILTERNKEILSRSPYLIERHDILFVHASPYQPEWWYYILSPANAQKNFHYFKQSLCFVGHSHVPAVYCEDDRTTVVSKEKRFIVNVGSIGQPRDHVPKLSFGIFDTGTWRYENIRASYDITTAANKIYDAGLPSVLAERLYEGK